MNRLTQNNGKGWALKLDNPQTDIEAREQLMSKFKIACAKLGELEDFMEMCGYDSVEIMASDIGYMKGYIESQVTEICDLKEHTHDLNNKLLNLQLFLKDLRDSFHKEDEAYEEIDKKLKELGGDR